MKFDFDFLKDRYDHELPRREPLTAALTLPLGGLTLPGGAMAALARSFCYKDGLRTRVCAMAGVLRRGPSERSGR